MRRKVLRPGELSRAITRPRKEIGMAKLRFTDGVEFDTSGKLRVEKRRDGFYVVGDGMLVAVDSRKEGEEFIAEMKGDRVYDKRVP